MIHNGSATYQHGSSPPNHQIPLNSEGSYMSSSSSVLLQQTPPSPTSLLSSTIATSSSNNNNFSNEHHHSASSSVASRVQSTTFSTTTNNNNNNTTNNSSQQLPPHHLLLSASNQYSQAVNVDLVLFYHFMEESKRANLLQIMLEGKKASTTTSNCSSALSPLHSSKINIENSSDCRIKDDGDLSTLGERQQPWLVIGNAKNVQVACEVAEMLIRYSADTNKRWLFQMAIVKASMSDVSIDDVLHHLIWLASSHVPPVAGVSKRKISNSHKSAIHSNNNTTGGSEQQQNVQTTTTHSYKRRNSNKSNNGSGTTNGTSTTKQPDHGSIISQNGNRNNSLYSSSVTSVSSISSCSTDRTLSMLSTTSSVLDDEVSNSDSPNTESILQTIPLHQNPSPSEPVKITRKIIRKIQTNSVASSPMSPMTPPIHSPCISDTGSDYSSSPVSTITSRPQIVQKGILRKATVTTKVIKKTCRSPGDVE